MHGPIDIEYTLQQLTPPIVMPSWIAINGFLKVPVHAHKVYMDQSCLKSRLLRINYVHIHNVLVLVLVPIKWLRVYSFMKKVCANESPFLPASVTAEGEGEGEGEGEEEEEEEGRTTLSACIQ